MSKSAISDEQIIAALLSNGTIRAAAPVVGLSERAIYERMNTGKFQTLYTAAKADLLRKAVFNLEEKLQAAVDTVADIMQNENNNPAVRLQAAQTIMGNAAKLSQRLQAEETTSQVAAVESMFMI